jgi:hypothetical protein
VGGCHGCKREDGDRDRDDNAGEYDAVGHDFPHGLGHTSLGRVRSRERSKGGLVPTVLGLGRRCPQQAAKALPIETVRAWKMRLRREDRAGRLGLAPWADPVLGHPIKPHSIKHLKDRGRELEELIG